jgi:hypothetical protein
MSKNLSQERIGAISKNAHDSLMEVVEYNNALDIWVKFEQGNPIHTNWYNFLKGNVQNPYDKSVYGIGYLGEGNYKAIKNGKMTPQYAYWISMLRRSQSEKYHKKYPTYRDTVVCDEWLNFQNFAKWYDINYYEIEGERMELDKDIIFKANKVYSPETCVFVPNRINSLFVKNDATRGELPIGVCYHKHIKKYVALCNSGKGEQVSLGYYKNPDEAFNVYKIYKEEVIKKVAEEYKVKIPNVLYEALINYKVEITD